MSRLKRGSRVLRRAHIRYAGVTAIDHQLDLGNGISLAAYQATIEKAQAHLSRYNTTLAIIDSLYLEFLAAEREVAAMSEKILLGVAFRYGKDSKEYCMAGGIPRSQYKLRKRRPQPTPVESDISTETEHN
jgi:hypothetical protein